MIRNLSRAGLLVGLALSIAACESATGADGSQTTVLLSRGSASVRSISAAVVAGASATAQAAPLTAEDIASINVTITGVSALPVQADTASAGEATWVQLDLAAPASVNLLALPANPENGLLLARGDLPAGTYGNLRIRFSTATVTFKREVRVGQVTYPANQPISLTVPSGRIYVPLASFTAGEVGTEVKLVFDASASARNIHATGANKVIMTPVIGGRVDTAD